MKAGKEARTRCNLGQYENHDVVNSYRNSQSLQNPEISVLRRIEEEFRGKRILDIGVGTGRTTPALLEISNDYVGIDAASSMISVCRSKFPTVLFEIRDARDLSAYGDCVFDLVFFSFNGLDTVDHTGRFEALGEIHRVLTDGGAFVFSTHNLRGTINKPWNLPTVPWRINPLRRPRYFSRETMKFTMNTFNHIRNRRHEEWNDGFAIVNDQAHSYRLLHYYVNIETQVGQLTEIGFHSIEPVDLSGRWLSEDAFRCKDTWIYYLCRK